MLYTKWRLRKRTFLILSEEFNVSRFSFFSIGGCMRVKIIFYHIYFCDIQSSIQLGLGCVFFVRKFWHLSLWQVWTPPTPPQDDNDIYVDSTMLLMYDTTPMPESKLPPVYVRKEHKRLKTDPSGRPLVPKASRLQHYSFFCEIGIRMNPKSFWAWRSMKHLSDIKPQFTKDNFQ